MNKPHSEPQYLRRTVKGHAYAFCRYDGRQVALGRYGSPESFTKYERCLAAFRTNTPEVVRDSDSPMPVLTVGEIAEKFLAAEKARMGNTQHVRYRLRHAMLDLVEAHAVVPAVAFGPKAFRSIRDRLTASGLARSEVNTKVYTIRRAFKWAVSEELIPVSVLQALHSVPALRAGEAKENPERTPASPRDVEATAAALDHDGFEGIAGAVRLLRWTGCRPVEVCRARIGDIEQTPEGMLLRLHEHKTRKATGSDRLVPLNDQAAVVVREAMAGTGSLDPVHPLFKSSRGVAITPNALYQAVARSTKRHGIPHWTPYQLRHLAATEVIAATGSETAAAALLGHTLSSTIVRRYSRERSAQARLGANAVGFMEAG